jgi:hypothetical protein
MRSALRWSSLVAAGAVLYALGAKGFHHRQFNVFIVTVLVLAVLIVVTFVLTSRPRDGGPESR